MSDYKAGDRVRVTFEATYEPREFCEVAEFSFVSKDYPGIRRAFSMPDELLTIEKIEPPEPEYKPFTVVEDVGSNRYIRNNAGSWTFLGTDKRYSDGSLRRPLTVLALPVDPE